MTLSVLFLILCYNRWSYRLAPALLHHQLFHHLYPLKINQAFECNIIYCQSLDSLDFLQWGHSSDDMTRVGRSPEMIVLPAMLVYI